MNIHVFIESLTADTPPQGINSLLLSLWYDAKGDWEKSHNIAQDIDTKDGAWIHAYLHRKEGDLWNADYWYSRASKKRPYTTLEEEWRLIVEKLLS